MAGAEERVTVDRADGPARSLYLERKLREAAEAEQRGRQLYREAQAASERLARVCARVRGAVEPER